ERDEAERERDQNRRIHERGDRLAAQRRDDSGVLDIAPKHRIEAAAALAGQERRRVDAWKKLAVRRERVRHRSARAHFLVDVFEQRSEQRRLHAPLQQIERLYERHAGLEQRRQFLVEDEELGRRDAPFARQVERHAGNRALWLQRENVEALLL